MAARTETVGTGAETGERSEAWGRWIPRIAGYVVFLAFWSWASGTLISEALLPSPTRILQEMGEIISSGLFVQHFFATIRKLMIGFAIAFFLGAAVGILMARLWWDGFFRGWVISILNTPGLVFALLAAIIFGFSPFGPIWAIVVTSFPFVAVNVAEGAKAIPKDLVDMARAFRVDGARRMMHVTIPFLAPFLFTAARYGFSVAWKIATLTEVFGSNEGIGFMFRREFQLFSMAGMLSWIFFFFVFALLLEKLVLQKGMNRFFRWRREVTL